MTRNAILGLGLLALIILAILCVWTHAGSIWIAQAGMPPLVDLTADAGTIVVRGLLPDETTRMRLVTRAHEVFGADRVTDRLRVTDSVGAPRCACMRSAVALSRILIRYRASASRCRPTDTGSTKCRRA